MLDPHHPCVFMLHFHPVSFIFLKCSYQRVGIYLSSWPRFVLFSFGLCVSSLSAASQHCGCTWGTKPGSGNKLFGANWFPEAKLALVNCNWLFFFFFLPLLILTALVIEVWIFKTYWYCIFVKVEMKISLLQVVFIA